MSAPHRIMVWTGGAALLAATLIDTLSVIGRHIGWPVHGSIELIQAAVLVSGGQSLLSATLANGHARVHFVLDRLSPTAKALAERACHGATATFFACMLIGSAWIAADLWGGHEQSELLGVSWAAMRAFANLCLAITLAFLLAKAVRRAR